MDTLVLHHTGAHHCRMMSTSGSAEPWDTQIKLDGLLPLISVRTGQNPFLPLFNSGFKLMKQVVSVSLYI